MMEEKNKKTAIKTPLTPEISGWYGLGEQRQIFGAEENSHHNFVFESSQQPPLDTEQQTAKEIEAYFKDKTLSSTSTERWRDIVESLSTIPDLSLEARERLQNKAANIWLSLVKGEAQEDEPSLDAVLAQAEKSFKEFDATFLNPSSQGENDALEIIDFVLEADDDDIIDMEHIEIERDILPNSEMKEAVNPRDPLDPSFAPENPNVELDDAGAQELQQKIEDLQRKAVEAAREDAEKERLAREAAEAKEIYENGEPENLQDAFTRSAEGGISAKVGVYPSGTEGAAWQAQAKTRGALKRVVTKITKIKEAARTLVNKFKKQPPSSPPPPPPSGGVAGTNDTGQAGAAPPDSFGDIRFSREGGGWDPGYIRIDGPGLSCPKKRRQTKFVAAAAAATARSLHPSAFWGVGRRTISRLVQVARERIAAVGVSGMQTPVL